MAGSLIVIEGPDAVGKSTLTELLHELLSQFGIDHEALSFPGKQPGTLGSLVYGIHHDPKSHGLNSVSPLALQALHIAAHLDSIEKEVLPALESNKWVVLDRFWWSTWVYGRAVGAPPAVLESLIEAERLLLGPVVPAVVFLVCRTEPLRDDMPAAEFLTLSRLYHTLGRAQASSHEVMTMEDLDPGAARDILEQWVLKRTAI
jgi:dTMP kinase